MIHQDSLLLRAAPDAHGYYSGQLRFPGKGLRDRELVFEAYDASGKLLKVETIVVLTGQDPIQWPTLELRTSVTDLATTGEVPVTMSLKNGTVFTLGGELRYAFAHHKGWDRGEVRSQRIDPSRQLQTLADSYQVPEDSVMLSVFAGTEIRFGKFLKTLYAHRYLYRGNWADPLRVRARNGMILTD